MSQLTALQIRAPELDLAGAASKAATVQNQRAQSGLSQLKLRDETGRSNAVHGYREGLKAGDPDAKDSLAGYPEIEAEFQKTFDAMETAEEKKAAAAKAKALGEAARHLSMIPEGREREAAADVVLGQLVENGTIDENMAARAKQTGITDLFLAQYLSLDEWVQREFPDEDTKLDRRKTEAGIAKDEAQARMYEAEAAALPGKQGLDRQKLEADIARIEQQTAEAEGKGDREDRATLLKIEKAVTEAYPMPEFASAEERERIAETRREHRTELMRRIMGRSDAAPQEQAEAPPRRQARNAETGEIATFEFRDGAWVRVSE